MKKRELQDASNDTPSKENYKNPNAEVKARYIYTEADLGEDILTISLAEDEKQKQNEFSRVEKFEPDYAD